MVKRWIIYLAALIGCAIFDIAYGQWLGETVLLMVALLPAVSLLLSLPAMLQARVRLPLPDRVQMGENLVMTVQTECPLPVPKVVSGVAVKTPLHNLEAVLAHGDKMPTEHCGAMLCKLKRPLVTDYLGLIPLPVRGGKEIRVTVMPRPVPMEDITAAERVIAATMKPKAGGGYSEHHELRLYRPGDSLNQIHWKLSAKNREYIVREPMEPLLGKLTLTAELMGTPEQLDEVCGKLLYFSEYLLLRGYDHRIRVSTGAGVREYAVETEDDCLAAMEALLACPPAQEKDAIGAVSGTRFHIGGGGV